MLNRYEEASACRIVTILSPEGLVTVDFGCEGVQPAVLAAVERGGVITSGPDRAQGKTTDPFRTKGNIESEWTNHHRRELED